MTTHQITATLDVLIADDDADLRQSVRLLLEGHGYRCAEAADGREAVALALRRPPRCLLLDLSMPQMDGLAVARTLRADPRTSGSHIHCVSGSNSPLAMSAATAAGFELYLAKPVDPDALLAAVGGAVGQRRSASVVGLTMAQARDLLDWLENQGCSQLEVALEGGGFTVRCHCPPGRRLTQDEAGEVRLLAE